MGGPLDAVSEVGALFLLLILACPAIMAAMMLLMWRSMRDKRRNDKT